MLPAEGLDDAEAGDGLLEVGVDAADALTGQLVRLDAAAAEEFVPMISTGRVAKTTRASWMSRTSRATVMPKKVTTETNAVTRPVWRNVERASTSVVIRVMIRPVSSRS
ncbi:hypothetical protein SMICM17S_07089 [Streptomyces microflavus]